MRLLVAEDNERLGGYLRTALSDRGFTVDLVETAGDAEAALFSIDYKALILDLGLPDADGMSLLKAMRKNSDMRPVLILTARDSTQMLVDSLNSGADDYLCKPFEMDELVARIRALLRRPGERKSVTISEANLLLDTVEREVRIDGKIVEVPRREFYALELLLRRTGSVVSKSTMESMLYAFGEEVASNAIEVLIHRLRRRIADAGKRGGGGRGACRCRPHADAKGDRSGTARPNSSRSTDARRKGPSTRPPRTQAEDIALPRRHGAAAIPGELQQRRQERQRGCLGRVQR